MSVIVLTRPEEDATATRARLEAAGHQVLMAPMLVIKAMTFRVPDPARSLIITSKNAVRHGLANLPDRDRAIFAVGEATAKAARDLGFSNITVGPGNVKGLMPLLREYETVPRIYTYMSGEDVAYDICGALKADGIDAEDEVVYVAHPAPEMPEDVIAAFEAGEVDHVLFYSPRLASTFEELVSEMGKLEWLREVDAYCLSTRVKESLFGRWRSKKYALLPSEKAMMSLIGIA